jgi:hypothetical protein
LESWLSKVILLISLIKGIHDKISIYSDKIVFCESLESKKLDQIIKIMSDLSNCSLFTYESKLNGDKVLKIPIYRNTSFSIYDEIHISEDTLHDIKNRE